MRYRYHLLLLSSLLVGFGEALLPFSSKDNLMLTRSSSSSSTTSLYNNNEYLNRLNNFGDKGVTIAPKKKRKAVVWNPGEHNNNYWHANASQREHRAPLPQYQYQDSLNNNQVNPTGPQPQQPRPQAQPINGFSVRRVDDLPPSARVATTSTPPPPPQQQQTSAPPPPAVTGPPPVTRSKTHTIAKPTKQPETPSSDHFMHAPLSYFDVSLLTSKGPRKGADIGEPHDATRKFADLGTTLRSGSWWCAAGGWPSMTPRATTEIFFVLTGHGCLTDADGQRHFFGPGDTVILPKGWYVL